MNENFIIATLFAQHFLRKTDNEKNIKTLETTFVQIFDLHINEKFLYR